MLTDIFVQAVFVFYIITYEPTKYGKDYNYPQWAQNAGLCISFSSMIWIPAYAIYYLLTQPGTILEVLVSPFVQLQPCLTRCL